MILGNYDAPRYILCHNPNKSISSNGVALLAFAKHVQPFWCMLYMCYNFAKLLQQFWRLVKIETGLSEGSEQDRCVSSTWEFQLLTKYKTLDFSYDENVNFDKSIFQIFNVKI